MKTITNRFSRVAIAAILFFVAIFGSLLACTNNDILDPNNPVTVTLWHYYTGTIETAFEDMIKEFNETTGKNRGVIVESKTFSNLGNLESAILASANNDVKAEPMPDIFSSYADSAYEIEKMGMLANLGDYLTKAEQAAYVVIY